MGGRGRLTAVALVAALVGGCGGSGGGPSDDLSPAAFIGSISDAQSKVTSAHMTVASSFQGQKVTGQGDFSGPEDADSIDDVAMSITMKAPDGKRLEMRMVDAVMYMNLGAETDDKFVKVDLRDTSNPIGKAFSQLSDQLDPAKQMKAYEKAVVSYSKKGDAITLDGVKAQPYEIVVDTTKLPKPDIEGPQPKMPKRLRTTIYVGPDQLPRRMTMDMGGVSTQVDYTDWGQDVSIEKPEPSQISDQDPFAPTAES